MHLTLTRRITANGAVLGELSGLPKRLYVLEDEWRNNLRGLSCIPVGTYEVEPHGWESLSPVKFKQSWQLQKVPNRTAILIHAGNTHEDTQGCLLVGMGLIISQLKSSVTDSRMAMDYLRKVIGPNSFTLTVQ